MNEYEAAFESLSLNNSNRSNLMSSMNPIPTITCDNIECVSNFGKPTSYADSTYKWATGKTIKEASCTEGVFTIKIGNETCLNIEFNLKKNTARIKDQDAKEFVHILSGAVNEGKITRQSCLNFIEKMQNITILSVGILGPATSKTYQGLIPLHNSHIQNLIDDIKKQVNINDERKTSNGTGSNEEKHNETSRSVQQPINNNNNTHAQNTPNTQETKNHQDNVTLAKQFNSEGKNHKNNGLLNDAFNSFKNSALLGNADALTHLINLGYECYNTTKVYPMAFKCFLEAANHGSALGQYNVGACYANKNAYKENETTPIQDLKEAFKFYKLSADQKDANGLYGVGRAYENGEVYDGDGNKLPANLDLALKNYEDSFRKNNTQAREALERLAKNNERAKTILANAQKK